MSTETLTERDELLALLRPCRQEHLLAFWDKLNEGQRESLAAEIRGIDLPLIARLTEEDEDPEAIRRLANRAHSPLAIRLGDPRNRFSPEEARRRGEEALRAGQVAAMLVAGGQGTRLGFDHPKGMFPVGPVSDHTLFQIHLEKIQAVARRYGVRVPLYVMTSPATHEETLEFFAKHDRFGFPEDDFFVFCQGTMPAVAADSKKVLLEQPDHVALSPDGHGGMLAAFARSGGMADAQRRGIRQVFYFQVDNPLVDVCGPEFLGYHLLADSEMTTQVVSKKAPKDRVGNVVEVDGRLRVIEYSDLPDDVAERRNPDGSLAIWAGSIAVHVFDVSFLDRMAASADSLPFHRARKKVPCIDPASGRHIEPDEPNAIKYERFIFDLMPSAANALVVEVDPVRCFGPLKNASGQEQDTPETVKTQMIALHTEWLRQAGAEVAPGTAVEISPLYALDAEELARRLPPRTRVTGPKYFR